MVKGLPGLLRALAQPAGRAAGLPRAWARALARGFIRRGDRAAALHVSHDADPVIHSLLGMHLSTLDSWRGYPNAGPDDAVAMVRSLAATGDVDAALQKGTECIRRWPARGREVATLLLSADARRALPFLGAWPTLAAAAEESLGLASAALARLDRSPNAAEPWLRINLLRANGHHADADDALRRAFVSLGLRPVTVDLAYRGVCAFATSDSPSTSAERSTPRELVSVVMPVHDVEAYVETAVRSVLGQDHGALELIVVDDASRDGTADRVESIAAGDSRVRLIRSERLVGAYGARNAGMQLATGRWLTFHDGDDWSHPQKLSLQLDAVRRTPGAVASISDWVRVDDSGRFCARQSVPLQRLNTSSMLVLREAVCSRLGGFDAVRTGADSEYLGRLALLFGGEAIVRLRLPLSFGAARPDSLTSAASTGFASERGMRQRLEYWEAWNRWHARRFASGLPTSMLIPSDCRPFPVDAALLMSAVTPST